MKRMLFTISRSSNTTTKKSQSFHKRQLPSSLTALSSPQGKALFKEALATDGMESYFPLAEQFVTQSDPYFCSLSSLTMVLNALNFDPKKVWKGLWRWVSEETLQCESTRVCGHSLERIKTNGLSFMEFESLARCHGVKISSHRVSRDVLGNIIDETDPDGLEGFRSLVERISSDDRAETFIVVNYSRKVLGQTGDGHFSPIGGYHKEKQLVLIMDVARFKYPPYWVPLEKLWAAMAEVDSKTLEPRGYFVVSGWSTKQLQADPTEELLQAEALAYQAHSHAHDHTHSHEHLHQECHSHLPGGAHQRSSTHARVASENTHFNCDNSASSNVTPPSIPRTTTGITTPISTSAYVHSSTAPSSSSSSSSSSVRVNRVANSTPYVPSNIANPCAIVHSATDGDADDGDDIHGHFHSHSHVHISTTVVKDASAGGRVPGACPPRIRTWEDFRKYVPKNMCQTRVSNEGAKSQ